MSTSLDDMALRESDARAVMNHALHGTSLDPEVAARVHERSRRATEAVHRRLGTVDVAVELVRQGRDGE
jgi:hypothetical protein